MVINRLIDFALVYEATEKWTWSACSCRAMGLKN